MRNPSPQRPPSPPKKPFDQKLFIRKTAAIVVLFAPFVQILFAYVRSNPGAWADTTRLIEWFGHQPNSAWIVSGSVVFAGLALLFEISMARILAFAVIGTITLFNIFLFLKRPEKDWFVLSGTLLGNLLICYFIYTEEFPKVELPKMPEKKPDIKPSPQWYADKGPPRNSPSPTPQIEVDVPDSFSKPQFNNQAKAFFSKLQGRVFKPEKEFHPQVHHFPQKPKVRGPSFLQRVTQQPPSGKVEPPKGVNTGFVPPAKKSAKMQIKSTVRRAIRRVRWKVHFPTVEAKGTIVGISTKGSWVQWKEGPSRALTQADSFEINFTQDLSFECKLDETIPPQEHRYNFVFVNSTIEKEEKLGKLLMSA